MNKLNRTCNILLLMTYSISASGNADSVLAPVGVSLMEMVMNASAGFMETIQTKNSGIGHWRYKFRASDKPGYLRHRKSELWTDPLEKGQPMENDTQWNIDLPGGLCKTGIRFQSVNYPKYFLKHSNFLIYISKETENSSKLYTKDTCWKVSSPLDGNALSISFESFNFPGCYLTHKDDRVALGANDGSESFKEHASWNYLLQGFF